MKDKVVIITGASSGIGLACAKEFARKKAKVVLAARSLGILNEIAEEIDSEGKNVLVAKVDVSLEADCQHLIEETIKVFGRIDILVNHITI